VRTDHTGSGKANAKRSWRAASRNKPKGEERQMPRGAGELHHGTNLRERKEERDSKERGRWKGKMIIYGVTITRKRNMLKLQAAEMRFLKSVKGCTRLDKIRNEDIKKYLGVFPTNDRKRR
jgi:hypothetical protein